MFAREFTALMSAVLAISKKHDIPAPRVGTAEVDKILAHMLMTLDAKLDESKAECAKMMEELNELRKRESTVSTGEL